MAGHSKWANIQHRKGRQDAKRGKVFTKLIKEITVAAKMGGGDLSANPRLRLAIEKAKGQSLPKDNIDNAIKRGTGQLDGVNYEELRYEGYGINGAAVIVDCLTDNKTRTVAEVRHAFAKHGGNMGTDGSVAFLCIVEIEQTPQQQRSHVGHRSTHRMPRRAKHIPKLDRIGLWFPIADMHLVDAFLQTLRSHTQRAKPGQIAFGIGEKHRYTG